MGEAKLEFEDALCKLEEIVKELESGGLSLDKSLARFTEGVKLIKFCNNKLSTAEKKIEMVLQENDELKSIVPFFEEEAQ